MEVFKKGCALWPEVSLSGIGAEEEYAVRVCPRGLSRMKRADMARKDILCFLSRDARRLLCKTQKSVSHGVWPFAGAIQGRVCRFLQGTGVLLPYLEAQEVIR